MTDFDPTQLTDEQIRLVMAEAARRGASKRPRGERVCVACGTAMPEVLKTRRYCSNACRVRAAYWRDKDADADPTAPFMTPLAGKGWETARTYTRKKVSRKGKRP